MPIYPGVSDSQKKVPPLPPSVASRSDSGSGRAFDNGATFLTFNPTIFDGKLPIIDYLITATAEDNVAVTQTVTDLNSFVFTGLRSGVRYRYKIRARNSVSDSADSSEVGPDTATTVPGRPTSLTAINLSNGGGITLNWVAPSNAGKAITSYTITPTVGAPIVTNSTSTTYAFSGVVGTVYNFTVAATNENGTGEASTASGTVTPTPAPTPTPPPPTSIGGGQTGATIGITSFTASTGLSELGQLVVVGNWSAFGFASWSLSGIGTSTGIVNGTASSGAPGTGPLPSTYCGQTATATLVVYSGVNGTGTSATSNANFTVPSTGIGCGSGGVTPGTNTYKYTVCCNTGGTYALKYGDSLQSLSDAQYFANIACTGGGGTVQGGTGAYSTSFPTLSCSAPVALPCSSANGNCSSATCAACDGALSGGIWGSTGTVADSSCPSGFRNATTCWTGGSCPNTPILGSCTSSGGGVVTTVTPATTFCPSLGANVLTSGYPGNCPGAVSPTPTPIVSVVPSSTVQTCSGPCNGTWSIVGGVCRCTATPTPTPTPVATATPRPTSSSCACRDFRGRCVSAAFCIA